MDPASPIAKMKDGRADLAYKAEHVDPRNELVLAAENYPANRGDTDTLHYAESYSLGSPRRKSTRRPSGYSAWRRGRERKAESAA